MKCLAAILFVLTLAAPAMAAPFPTKYDAAIKAAVARWMPGVPWIIWKAQLYQESRLDPSAVSGVGAAGIAQFMPATWKAIAPALHYELVDPRAAGPAIDAGAYLMAELRAGWHDLPDTGRHDHAMASYNAGPGNIRKAWTRCGKAEVWKTTAPCLASVTGKHSAETITYVARIWRWYFELL